MSKWTEVKTGTFSTSPEEGMGLGFPKRFASAGSWRALRSLAVPAGSHLQPEPTGLCVPAPGAAGQLRHRWVSSWHCAALRLAGRVTSPAPKL